MKGLLKRHLYYTRLRRFHRIHNFYNSLPTIRKSNFKWYGLNSAKHTLLRSSTFLFQLTLSPDVFLTGDYSKTIFYKKSNIRLRRKYVKFSNSLSIAGTSNSSLTSKFLLKTKLAVELINVHMVKSKRVKIIFNIKNALLGLSKSNLSAREIDINKSILLIKSGPMNAREIEVSSLARIFDSLAKEGAS
jgi:hypothetical protein